MSRARSTEENRNSLHRSSIVLLLSTKTPRPRRAGHNLAALAIEERSRDSHVGTFGSGVRIMSLACVASCRDLSADPFFAHQMLSPMTTPAERIAEFPIVQLTARMGRSCSGRAFLVRTRAALAVLAVHQERAARTHSHPASAALQRCKTLRCSVSLNPSSTDFILFISLSSV